MYEKAITEANKMKEINENIIHPYNRIIECYSYMNKDDEFMAELEKRDKIWTNRSEEDLANEEAARKAFQKTGIKGYWMFWTDIMIKNGWGPLAMAQNLSYYGEIDKSLDYLELAYEQDPFRLINIKSERDFWNLRKEPRFLAILDKLNLGGYE